MAGDPVTPRPAAAVVLLRDSPLGLEVLMVRRHGQSAFMPNVYVFPGGTVQESDRALETDARYCAPVAELPDAQRGFRLAALRECFEEAGVLLARRGATTLQFSTEEAQYFADYRDALNQGNLSIADIAEREGLTLATDELVHWSHWITPPSWPRRFDTHFFLARMPDEQQAMHDHFETTESLWLAPKTALERHHRGDFGLVYATMRQLEELAEHTTVQATLRHFATRPVRAMRPFIVRQDGKDVVLLPDEA